MRTSSPPPPHARRRGQGGLVAALAAAGALAMLPAPDAHAEPAGRAAAKPTVDVKKIQDDLQSKEASVRLAALATVKAEGPAADAAAPAVEDVLVRGTTVAIGKAAIEALGAIGRPSSSAILRPYLRHREPELRRAAARALGATKGPDAAAGFREGLRGADGIVRGYSASGLGTLGATDALPELFLALDRGVTESAAAIGQLAGPAECKRFTSYLGKLGFDVMTSGFDPMLFRQKSLPEEAQVEIVSRVRDLATPEAGRYLADVLSRWPASGSAKVKQILVTAVDTIAGARGGMP
jgi:HEAT repeat protein